MCTFALGAGSSCSLFLWNFLKSPVSELDSMFLPSQNMLVSAVGGQVVTLSARAWLATQHSRAVPTFLLNNGVFSCCQTTVASRTSWVLLAACCKALAGVVFREKKKSATRQNGTLHTRNSPSCNIKTPECHTIVNNLSDMDRSWGDPGPPQSSSSSPTPNMLLVSTYSLSLKPGSSAKISGSKQNVHHAKCQYHTQARERVSFHSLNGWSL